MQKDLFRVYCRIKGQDTIFWGEPMSCDTANFLAKRMNQEHPEREYWATMANMAKVYERDA